MLETELLLALKTLWKGQAGLVLSRRLPTPLSLVQAAHVLNASELTRFIFSFKTSFERSYLLCQMGPCSPEGSPGSDTGPPTISAGLFLQTGQPGSALFFQEPVGFLALL